MGLLSLWCHEDTYLRSFARSLLKFLGFIFWGTLESAMGYLVHQHNWTCSQDPGSSAVDVMQRKLRCCGVHNYTDWLKASSSSWYHPACVPESCCKEKHPHCKGDLDHVEQLYPEGCLKKLEDHCFAGPAACVLGFVLLCVCIGIQLKKKKKNSCKSN
uniref:Uncharacterized protein n=1 Tax=Corvus moneduloides TaxID=1196302 RepID=A0A8U7NV12_CORMO